MFAASYVVDMEKTCFSTTTVGETLTVEGGTVCTKPLYSLYKIDAC